MFIVRHIPTGKYFKKGRWPRITLTDDRQKATVLRNKAAIKLSLGKMVNIPREKRKRDKRGRMKYYTLELDETVWEAVEITL